MTDQQRKDLLGLLKLRKLELEHELKYKDFTKNHLDILQSMRRQIECIEDLIAWLR